MNKLKVVTLQEAKEKLEKEIKELEEDIEDFQGTLDLDDYETMAKYDDWIDELYGTIRLGETEWETAYVLSQIDPVAYRVGFNEWIDSMDEHDLKMFPEYRDMLERKEELEEELEAVEVAIEERETKEAMEEDDE